MSWKRNPKEMKQQIWSCYLQCQFARFGNSIIPYICVKINIVSYMEITTDKIVQVICK